jgi:hypothetical protein
MAEYVRIATFEADEAALDAFRSEVSSAEGPPEGVPAKSIMLLADRSGGKLAFVVRFDSEENLRKGNETLEAMSPPTGRTMRRISVESYEVVLEREAP